MSWGREGEYGSEVIPLHTLSLCMHSPHAHTHKGSAKSTSAVSFSSSRGDTPSPPPPLHFLALKAVPIAV